jgi:hypothetical protein
LGCQGTSYLEPRDWVLTVSYRHYRAFRDYQGSTELPVPSPPFLYADSRVNVVDVALTYSLSSRWSFTLQVPFAKSSRETYVEHDLVSLHTMRASGFGDAQLIANAWLLDPSTHPNENFSAKFGLKTPTGAASKKDYSYRETGPVLRPVDPAIQPGTGGWGLVFGAQAFKKIYAHASVYADAIYLSNPKEMNGTESPFGDVPELTFNDIGYIIDSVPDQYSLRAGISHEVPPIKGLSGMFGLRMDGVNASDLFGGSDGYRLPGYSVSIEPGVSFAYGKNFFSVNVPVTVRGHGSKTLADIRTGNPVAGTVTIADSQLILSYSRRF